ncbi:hypothetical protein CONCODRAFT_13125 [Conidiobolus coronatus NRRL 28638]|uniref:Attractin/MKLN-like beta-propeller domain-containing protein n=1 Tax=Conidiobolus coronatus (strain ATCC 28846 / CBS 209.66 / NRRL 28638) TaxID=796925 RepID=A0A137NRE9_CONC2|nr:hypothetical protein CONCODRAFT_13125 [Conidiobolus coronatus NRRL 28638]|eukprot:KXN65321.1 hypothetical protein CONCODRAFT_13125 [Conidiobolus coronatus NRRL 28638]
MFLLLFTIYFLTVVSEYEIAVSVRVRGDKIIAIYQSYNVYNVKVRVFELKEGAISDIYKSRKTYDFGHSDIGFELKFIDIPDNFQEDKNKLWLKFARQGSYYGTHNSQFINWVGFINLNDMSLEKNFDFIKFPTDENFPVSSYTMNTITNKLGSALYITGGELYSKKNNSYSVSNSFFKYNFTTKEWKDMTNTANEKLKPLFDHSSAVIHDRYLVILGGGRQIIYNTEPGVDYSNRPVLKYNSLYNLTIFDTYSNSWENVNIKADIFETNIATFRFIKFTAVAHNDNIIVFGGTAGENQSNVASSHEYLGILDFKSKNWAWSPIRYENGSKYLSFISGESIKVQNDQLLIFTSILENRNNIPIHVYDLNSKRMKSTLRLSNSSNGVDSIMDSNEAHYKSKIFPNYAIVLITISCAVLLSAFTYLSYRIIKKNSISKNCKTKSNGPIREVWADPDIYNTNNIINFDENNRSNALYSNELNQSSDN